MGSFLAVVSSVLYAICLAPFEISYQDIPIALCSNRNGQAMMRYLIAQSNHSATADTLMTLFWPEEDTDIALRRLQVTVSILRRSFYGLSVNKPSDGFILYKQGTYLLNPTVPVQTDVDIFLSLYELGLQASSPQSAVSSFEQACALYTHPFLAEDLYADWSYGQRDHLHQVHLYMCNTLTSHYLKIRSFEKAAQWATVVLGENHCDEIAYQHLMRIYALQGRRNEAQRLYQRCKQVLQEELGMQPLPQTEALYHSIVRGKLDE